MAGSGWTVTTQLDNQIENTNAGQTITGRRVFFITGDGNEGSVFIAEQHFNHKNVRERIRREASLIDEIGKLAENYTG